MLPNCHSDMYNLNISLAMTTMPSACLCGRQANICTIPLSLEIGQLRCFDLGEYYAQARR